MLEYCIDRERRSVSKGLKNVLGVKVDVDSTEVKLQGLTEEQGSSRVSPFSLTVLLGSSAGKPVTRGTGTRPSTST